MLKYILFILPFLIAAPVQAERFDHSQWDRLVQSHVKMSPDRSSSVADYAQFKAVDAQLQSYLTKLSAVKQAEFDSWPKNDQLAFLINAYNAWTVKLIADAHPNLASILELGNVTTSPWQRRFIPLLGAQRSLDDIEHKMIRGSGRYNDPRIHFAVNCASIGCPALMDRAFTAQQLDSQMEAATKAFLSDRTRNYVDDKGAHVSSIFDWYGGDFKTGWRGADSVGGFLALYSGSLGVTEARRTALANGEMDISFLEYDWRLNDVTVPNGAKSAASMSPIWIARAFPVPTAIAGLLLLLLLYGGYRLIRRRSKAA
ncbi:DUF547 domain-containing protein [Sphingorhabdus arenilitoris]|uniref:DUF547 domain-containing protein n=1 Tax=Sphingorhabdus arenilitoris TaxID=1490041 RepID=A0ABV8REV8_9SPHN